MVFGCIFSPIQQENRRPNPHRTVFESFVDLVCHLIWSGFTLYYILWRANPCQGTLALRNNFFFVADCLSLLNSIGNCCQRENLHVLPRGTWTGDLRAWRVLNLQSTFTPGGSGHCWILMPQTGLAHWDETSKNAHKVEGDIRPVCVVSIHFNSPKNCNLLSIPRLLQLFWVTRLCS